MCGPLSVTGLDLFWFTPRPIQNTYPPGNPNKNPMNKIMFESMSFPFSLLAGYVIRSLEGKQKSLWPRPSRPTMPGEPGECGWLVVGCFLGVDIFFLMSKTFPREKDLWVVGWCWFLPNIFWVFFHPGILLGKIFHPF